MTEENGPDINKIFTRYKTFSKKRISKKLKGNDFMIATEGVINKSLILTCDKPMYNNIKKFYPDIFFIEEDQKSCIKFFNRFESRKSSKLNSSPKETKNNRTVKVSGLNT